MSLINFIVHKVLLKNKQNYDPNNPPDYPKARETDIKQNGLIPLPKTMKFASVNLGSIDTEIAYGDEIGDKAILYLHGGGFVSGCALSRRGFTANLSKRTGLPVYVPNYRLAPEHRFPAALDDCHQAYEALLKRFGPQNIFVIGESAGGNLVLALMHKIKDSGEPMPAGIAVLSPVVQFLEKYDSYQANYAKDPILSNVHEEMLDMYFEEKDPEIINHPYASPIHGDFSRFPKTLITVSETELLRDDAHKAYEAMKTQGVDVQLFSRKNLLHAWPIIASLPEAKKDIKTIAKFVADCLNAGSDSKA